MANVNALVTVDWLAANIGRDDVKVLDATWCMSGEEPPLPGTFIPGAQVFDVDVVADLTSPLKHTLPMASTFEAAMSKMGINNSDHVIIYDRHGFRAAPRTWWTFRMFGHVNTSILDGGLPAWMKAGRETSKEAATSKVQSDYKAKSAIAKVISHSGILAQLKARPQIADARSLGRFNGTEPEPRAGLRSGHIPGATSFPFGSIRDENANLKSLPDLAELVGRTGLDLDKPIITTCGSGITAAGLAFVFYLLGAKDVSVYDGSWTEWGASDAPIEMS